MIKPYFQKTYFKCSSSYISNSRHVVPRGGGKERLCFCNRFYLTIINKHHDKCCIVIVPFQREGPPPLRKNVYIAVFPSRKMAILPNIISINVGFHN